MRGVTMMLYHLEEQSLGGALYFWLHYKDNNVRVIVGTLPFNLTLVKCQAIPPDESDRMGTQTLGINLKYRTLVLRVGS